MNRSERTEVLLLSDDIFGGISCLPVESVYELKRLQCSHKLLLKKSESVFEI